MIKPYGLIYLATCLINGKQYVGQTVRANPDDRKHRHFRDAKDGGQTIFCRALRKYGEKNFSFEVIWQTNDALSLGISEQAFIVLFDTLTPRGYNMREGGVRGRFTAEAKKKIQDALSRPEIQDKLRKRYCLRGPNSPKSIFTWEQVRQIRISIESSVVLAERFNTSATCISNVKRGKTYKEEGVIYQGKFESMHARTRVSCICKQCGINFEINGWRMSDAGRGKYCSQSCYHQAQVIKHVLTRCEQCGQEIWRTPRLAKQKRFCSQLCSAKAKMGKPANNGPAVSVGLLKAYAEGRGPAQVRRGRKR